MRMTVATFAFKMPLYGIGLPLSAFPVSSTVFQSSEKLCRANAGRASKPFYERALLPSSRNIFRKQYQKNSSVQDTVSLCLEKQYHSVISDAKLLQLFKRIYYESEQMYGHNYKYWYICIEQGRSGGSLIADGVKAVALQIFSDEVTTGENVTIETEELSDCDFDQNALEGR